MEGMKGFFKLDTARAGFFDRESVLKAMDRKTRKCLSRIGGYLRKVAIRSLPFDDRISLAGHAPRSHLGLLRKMLFYSYDAQAKSVVVGPLLFRNKLQTPGAQLLEQGGDVEAKTKDGKTTILHYRPRPFMQPALQRSLPYIGEAFAEG
jgi:hypothetical protein